MQQKVSVIREAIVKVTQMLAGRGIKVTQRGSRAYVGFNKKTSVPEVLNVPYLPDNASEELLQAVQGFLDHEVAHILFDDGEAVVAADLKGKKISVMHNITTDCFIEREMEKRFRGSAYNLERVREWVIKDAWQTAWDKLEATPDATPIDYFRALLVPAFRAISGQRACELFMEGKWEKIAEPMLLIDFVRHDLPLVKDSWECLELSERIVAALTVEKEKEEVKPDEGDADESEPDDAADEPEDGETDADEPEDGDGADKPDSDDKKTKKKKSSKEKDEEKEDSTGTKSDSEESETVEDTTGDTEEDASGEGETGDAAEEGDPDDSGESEADEDYENTGVEGDEGIEIWLDDIEKIETDTQALVAQKISETYMADIAGQPWVIFTTEGDVIETYKTQPHFRDEWLIQQDNDVLHMVGPMQKELERQMMAKNRSSWEGGRKSGRINPAALHRLRVGDPRVFRKRVISKAKDTAVEILVDLSGSMNSSKIMTAMRSAFALSITLERCRVPHEVIGFTTVDYEMSHEFREQWNETLRKLGRSRFSRNERLLMPIFKGWGERVTPDVRRRFADAPHNREMLCENVDNECVQIAARRLAQRPEDRKILIVLSDGAPCHKGDFHASGAELKKSVRDIERSGIEVLGIGIETNSVQNYYPKNVVLRSVASLPTVLMGEMRKILLK